MKNQAKAQVSEVQSTDSATTTQEFEAKVLYQKIYGKWYAFTAVDGQSECLIEEVPAETVRRKLFSVRQSN